MNRLPSRHEPLPLCEGERVRRGRRARELGFSMAQVRELLALSDHDDKPCQDVDQLVQQQLAEIERKIADLTALRNELGQMLRSCQADKIGECHIIGSLGRHAVA